MFDSYCAVCHGKDGKGNGPAASAMKTPPIDLTALAKNSGGKYPASHVAAVIRGQAVTPSHGSQDMPVWGPLFSSISQGHEGQVQQRITNLVTYIESLQAQVGCRALHEPNLQAPGRGWRAPGATFRIESEIRKIRSR